MPKPKEEFSSSTTQKTSRGKGSRTRKAGAAKAMAGSGGTLTVTSVSPTGRVSGSMPTIQATVQDDEGINPPKTDVRLYLDGAEQKRFRYGRATGSLSYRPRAGTLSPGTHTVEIEASADGGRRTAKKSWTFTVSR
jgi:Bacterial Ig domain